jgi:hypothetical protein
MVMVPTAMLVGANADSWGHKRFFLAALLILPVRGALYPISDNAGWLVGVQRSTASEPAFTALFFR